MSGLTQIRNCGWLPDAARQKKIVWTRAGVFSTECPKSAITAESAAALERFNIWKAIGVLDYDEKDVRTLESLIVLEEAYREEINRENG